MSSDYLTTAEVATMFRVKPKTVASWCANGKYPRKYLMRTSGDTHGSKWLIHKDALKPKAPYKQINTSDLAKKEVELTSAILRQGK